MLSHSGRTAALVSKYRPAMVTPARTAATIMGHGARIANATHSWNAALHCWAPIFHCCREAACMHDNQFHKTVRSFVEQPAPHAVYTRHLLSKCTLRTLRA